MSSLLIQTHISLQIAVLICDIVQRVNDPRSLTLVVGICLLVYWFVRGNIDWPTTARTIPPLDANGEQELRRQFDQWLSEQHQSEFIDLVARAMERAQVVAEEDRAVGRTWNSPIRSRVISVPTTR